VVSVLGEGIVHRTTYAEVERRARKLAQALPDLGVRVGDRIATMAWNNHRHLELFFALPGSGAVCHTVNPRLHPDDIAYIINHAGDSMLFVDTGFDQLLGTIANPENREPYDGSPGGATAHPAGSRCHGTNALSTPDGQAFTAVFSPDGSRILTASTWRTREFGISARFRKATCSKFHARGGLIMT
jgi:acyl-CoA synthetase (AMP-forming)/AMP-acid ligase II